MADDLGPPEDLIYYNISSQDWQRMIITSPDGRVQYFTESERSFLKSKKRTTVIYKVDGAGLGTASNSSISLAKRSIARLEFRSDPRKNRIVYGLMEYGLDEFFPPVKWPQG